MLRLEAVQDGDARVGGALERAGIAEEEQVLGGVEDNQRISCLDKLAVDENTDRAVRPLDKEFRLVFQQLAGIEPRGGSLDVPQETVVERVADTARVHVGRNVAQRNAGADEEEVEALAVGDVADVLAGVVRDFVAGFDGDVQFLRAVEDGAEADFLEIIGVHGVYVGTDGQVQSGNLQLAAGLGEHLVGDVEHHLSVTRTAEGKEHLEDTLGLRGDRLHLASPLLGETIVDEGDERGRHKGRNQGHQHQHDEDGRRQDIHLVADGEDDQLHQTAGIHQRTDVQTILPRLAHETRRDHRAAELSEDGHGGDDAAHCPEFRTVQQTNLRPKTRRSKEKREEKGEGDILNLLGHNLPEFNIARHHDTRDESAKEGVQAQDFRQIRRADKDKEHESHQALVDNFLIMVDIPNHPQERTDGEEHQRNVNDREKDIIDRAEHRPRLGNRNNHGEEAPGSDVAVGSTRQGDCSQMGFRHSLLLNDSGQDGESRNTHGNADKEGKGEEWRAGISIRIIEEESRYHAEEERDDGAGMADKDGLVQLLADLAQIQLHPNGKHEKD